MSTMTGPRSVVYVIESLGHGGAEHQLLNTIRNLDRDRFSPQVVHFHEPGYLRAELERAGALVHGFGLARSKRSLPEALRRLLALHRAHRYDLVHSSLFEADLVAAAFSALARVPFVATLCNIGAEEARMVDNPLNSGVKLAASGFVWGAALRRSRRLIAISEAVKASCVRTLRLDPQTCRVVYRSVIASSPPEASNLDCLRRSILGPDACFPVLLTVGRLAPQKGQRYLLEALPAVCAAHPTARLLVVGEGWLKAELQAHAQAHGVGDRVYFLGTREDVKQLLRVCDVFVFPSLFEGLGVSLLEAGAAGCAIVATDTGPIPEVIDHGISGLLVPPRNAEAIAGAILDVLSRPEHGRELGRKAAERVLEKFSVARMMEGTHETYEAALGDTHERQEARCQPC